MSVYPKNVFTEFDPSLIFMSKDGAYLLQLNSRDTLQALPENSWLTLNG
jgi:hypothetical protein